MSAPNVAFCRTLKEGMSGADVIAHKRAISRWDDHVYHWTNFTPYFGPAFANAIVTFKKRNYSELQNILPIIGAEMHGVLERKHRRVNGVIITDEWAFDQRAITLAKEFCSGFGMTREDRIREAIVQAGFYWYSNRYSIRYYQGRPFYLLKPPAVPPWWDCSAFTTNCHYAGGAPDPNGRGYDHLGYTGTLMNRGSRVSSISSLKPGDMIFYGFSSAKPGFPAGSPTHVALYVGRRDGLHMVLSNGSYPMKYAEYRYRHDINHFRSYDVT